MKVGDLLKAKAGKTVTIRADATAERATRLLMDQRIGGLPVLRGSELVGFVAERDIVHALDIAGGAVRDVPVERVMQRPAPTCRADDSLHEVMARMTRERLRHLVVVDDNRLIGVLSVGDLVKHRLQEMEVEAGVLRDYVAARRAAT